MKFKKLLLPIAILGLASCNTIGEENETLKGFDIELARALGEELGVNIEFEEIVWEQKELELSSKNIDLIWNGLTITDERKENLEISNPYLENRQVIVTKDITTLSNETNYTVAFEAGSAGSDLFAADALFTNSTSVESNSQTDALTEVLSGTSDLAIIDSVMAGYYLNSNTSFSSLNILDYETESEYYGIAGRKGDVALINKVNEVLNTLYTNGKTLEIANTYGLADYLVNSTYEAVETTDDSLNYILEKGTLVIGYTIFAPIAYFD